MNCYNYFWFIKTYLRTFDYVEIFLIASFAKRNNLCRLKYFKGIKKEINITNNAIT